MPCNFFIDFENQQNKINLETFAICEQIVAEMADFHQHSMKTERIR